VPDVLQVCGGKGDRDGDVVTVGMHVDGEAGGLEQCAEELGRGVG
jgi:hypothetical protein